MLTLVSRLKDSDVTWLYGPLHTADPTPKPSPGAAAALDLSSLPSPPLNGAARKPILKHRSICELLTSELPHSPVFSPPDSEEDDEPHVMSDGADPGSLHKPIRPPLLHTKSDTQITRLGPTRAFRRDSPPRMVPNGPDAPASGLPLPESSVVPGQKRKHISFNTFVEQCIAIDKPKKKRPHYPTSNPHLASFDDDGSASNSYLVSRHSLLPLAATTRTRKTASSTRPTRSSLTTNPTPPTQKLPIPRYPIHAIPRPLTTYLLPHHPHQKRRRRRKMSFRCVSATPPPPSLALLPTLPRPLRPRPHAPAHPTPDLLLTPPPVGVRMAATVSLCAPKARTKNCSPLP